MPSIPALRRQRQVDLCEFKASLIYRVSSRTGSKATERNPVSEKGIQNKRNKGSDCEVRNGRRIGGL